MTSDSPNNNKLRNIVGVVLAFVLAIIFLVIAFKNVDFPQTFALMRNLSMGWFLLYIVLFYLSHLLRALRWKVLIKSVKEKTSVLNLFGSLMIGYGINVPVPRLGELYRGLFLGIWEGISRTSMLGSIILERFIDIFSFTIGALICIPIYSGNLLSEVSWLRNALIIGFIITLFFIVMLFAVMLFKERITAGIVKIARAISNPLAVKAESFFNMLLVGFASLKTIRDYFVTVLYTVLILLCYAVSAWAVFNSLGLQNVNFGIAWIYMILGVVAAMIPTPGNIGAYHMVTIFILHTLFGFSNETGAAFALLMNTSQVILFILTGIIFFTLINNLNAKRGIKKENFISVFRLREQSGK